MVLAPRQAHHTQCFHGHLSAGFLVDPTIDERKLKILKGGRAGQQIKALEHEPQKMAPQQRTLIAI